MLWTRRILLSCLLLLLSMLQVRSDDWPQWMGPQRDGIWRETGILEKFPAGGPKVLWRSKVSWGYAGPAVADGLVYVPDYWTSDDVRKASQPFRPKTPLKGKERLLCLDAQTGKQVWKYEYDCIYTVSYPVGPRCTPTVVDGKVYFLGCEGHLSCLDAKTGTVLWKKDFQKDYDAKTPIWGFCGHPLVEGKTLYCVVGGKDALVVAFDKDTGKQLWKALNANEPGYCPPTLITAGGTRQLLIWDPQQIHSLDPKTGKSYWSAELTPNYAMSIMAPRQLGNYLFAGGIGGKALLLELASDKPAVKEVWRGTAGKAVYPVNSTPILEEGTIYGVDQPGQLRAVDLQTGDRLWETTKPTTGDKPASSGTAFLVKNGDRFFLFSEKGELILARLDRKAYTEIDRWKMLETTSFAFGRDVVWSHPAFANKCVFARNDKEIVCVSLAK